MFKGQCSERATCYLTGGHRRAGKLSSLRTATCWLNGSRAYMGQADGTTCREIFDDARTTECGRSTVPSPIKGSFTPTRVESLHNATETIFGLYGGPNGDHSGDDSRDLTNS